MRDLYYAYLRYAERLNLTAEQIYQSDSAIAVKLWGKGVREAFAHESGKHVVQRVPPTESKGRRHTSVVSVAVMEVRPEVSSTLDLNEVDITTQRGHGKGGQHQNKTDSAVRAVHRPTGLMVFINGREQWYNKQVAIEVLASRVAQQATQKQQEEISAERRSQFSNCSRSGKVRTYNFIESYVTDHRTGNQIRDIKRIMKGEFDLLK